MVDVAIVDEEGAVVRQLADDTVICAFNDVLAKYSSDPDFCCLRFVDPYGDTIFNSLQAEVVSQELSSVVKRLEISEDRVAVEVVRALADEVMKSVHLYLKFLGD